VGDEHRHVVAAAADGDRDRDASADNAEAVYAMIERDLLPGVTRIGRRVLVRSADLLDFLDHNRTPSPQAALYAPESGRARRGDSIAGTARGSG
jgi:hypothetical protein